MQHSEKADESEIDAAARKLKQIGIHTCCTGTVLLVGVAVATKFLVNGVHTDVPSSEYDMMDMNGRDINKAHAANMATSGLKGSPYSSPGR